MKNLFNSVKMFKPKSNVFDLSHDVKLSFNMGELIPVMCEEAIPGDRFNIGCETLLRFAPMVAPIMHRVDMTVHYFFVPSRILWSNWEKFITNTEVGGLLPSFPFGQYSDGLGYGRLHDYFGLPNCPAPNQVKHTAMQFAAYQCTVNEYYRDQNLVPEIDYKLVDDFNDCSDGTPLGTLRRRAWQHDYFTAALPFAQKGDPVNIPIGSQKVILDPDAAVTDTPALIRRAIDHSLSATGNPLEYRDTTGELQDSVTTDEKVLDPNDTLITEDTGESTTINDLRRAFRLQEWLEKAARGGSRYVENILAHFGVRSSDKRLQRPEYITGVKSPVQISEVLQTSSTDAAGPQGNMAGHGVGFMNGKYGNYFCEEHGYVLGIMSVMPKTAYQDGVAKQFLKFTDPFQYYWPSFAHIGEQEVEDTEVWAHTGNRPTVFGYVPRYAEYKFSNNRVAGDFKTSLNFWHMGREFAVAPVLNEEFITCDPTHRIFAVTDPAQQKLWAHVYHKVKAVRPMPKFGTPTF